MRTPSHYGLVLVALVGGALAQPANAAPITLSSWTPAFQGVDSAQATFSNSAAYVDRIDLTAPGIGFTTTPPSGPLATTAQTTSQFLLSSGTQVAINANFFAPCCRAAPEPKSLIGLAISDGTLVSPATSGTADAASSLFLSGTSQAGIHASSAAGRVDLANAFNAVSGNLIVTNGVNTSSQTPTGAPHDPFGLDPRTDVGLSQDNRYLYLVAIDGREPGYSAGVTTSDAADFLLSLGAYQGLNLDGGGSTALVQSDGHGGAVLIDQPSGGAERYVGNNLGVFAKPLPVPEPGSLVLLATASIVLLGSRFRRASNGGARGHRRVA